MRSSASFISKQMKETFFYKYIQLHKCIKSTLYSFSGSNEHILFFYASCQFKFPGISTEFIWADSKSNTLHSSFDVAHPLCI